MAPRLAFLVLCALLCRALPMLGGFGAWPLATGTPTASAPAPLEIERALLDAGGDPRVVGDDRAPAPPSPSDLDRPRSTPAPSRWLLEASRVGHVLAQVAPKPPEVDLRALIRRHRLASALPRRAHPPSDDPAQRIG